MYREAMQIAPQSAYVRERYLWAIDPRWHGERSDIPNELKRISDSKLPDDTKRFLTYEGYMSLAGAHLTFKEPDRAEAAMQMASKQCVIAGPWQALANLYN